MLKAPHDLRIGFVCTRLLNYMKSKMVPLICFVLCILTAQSMAGFNPQRTRLLQYVDFPNGVRNILFRGDEPVTDSSFAKEALEASFKNECLRHNLTYPNSTFIIDYSLLDPLEFKDAQVEEKYFKENPGVGRYLNRIIVGDLVSPDPKGKGFPDKAKNLDKWSFDKLPTRIKEIYSFLTTPRNISTVIYIHCEAGVDRTGEVSGSYVMTYQNISFHEALAYDDHMESRLIATASRNGLQWYCYYLLYGEGRTMNCSIPPNETNYIL
eukprot:m.236484 g.236484  ORF g.236484 m.236484 type:complete len:267 (+) comp16050_c0_seq5:173-973(+)